MINMIVDCPVIVVVYRYYVVGQTEEKVRISPFSSGC